MYGNKIAKIVYRENNSLEIEFTKIAKISFVSKSHFLSILIRYTQNNQDMRHSVFFCDSASEPRAVKCNSMYMGDTIVEVSNTVLYTLPLERCKLRIFKYGNSYR